MNCVDEPSDTSVRPMRRVLSRVIAFGTEGYPAHTQRRLRLINSSILIANAILFGLFLAIETSHFVAGAPHFNVGNQVLVASVIALSISPFLHRFSDIAAPAYIFTIGMVITALNNFYQGTAQGSHYFSFLLLVSLPLLFGTQRHIVSLVAAFIVIAAFIYMDHFYPKIGVTIEGRSLETIQTIKYLQIFAIFAGIYFVVRHSFNVADNALAALQKEQDRSEGLLRNILPESIALRLKAEPGKIIADHHSDVTVIFVDFVGFTPKANRLSPEELVQFLNRVFSEFDDLVDIHGLEKIKTIGDAYMVVSGIPDSLSDNARVGADFALAVIERTKELSKELGEKVEVRIGMQRGDLVAGVIGKKKFAYDVWGDTVNVAARMESHGQPNRIQATETIKEALGDSYTLAKRGTVEIKGKGPMTLFYLTGRA